MYRPRAQIRGGFKLRNLDPLQRGENWKSGKRNPNIDQGENNRVAVIKKGSQWHLNDFCINKK